MRIFLHTVEFIVGFAIVVLVLDAAIRTFVLPRPAGVFLSRLLARIMRFIFDAIARLARTYEGQDRAMALYGPVTLLAFPVTWLIGVLLGFAAMYHATSVVGWRDVLRLSGSALFTLGFAPPTNGISVVMVFAEAAIGLLLVALLVAYLPTIYGAFSRREIAVTQLSVRAGSPPTPGELFSRAHRAEFTDHLEVLWQNWEVWFVELEETHTSLGILPFFRSPNPDRSWLTASGCVLDAAAFRLSAISGPYSPTAVLCLRSGFMALRSIADFMQLPYDPDPAPDDPISISREEFFAVYDQMEAAGVSVIPDREAAWENYRGWRVNYDAVLIGIAQVIVAPYAPWVSDRSLNVRRHRPPIFGNRSRAGRHAHDKPPTP